MPLGTTHRIHRSVAGVLAAGALTLLMVQPAGGQLPPTTAPPTTSQAEVEPEQQELPEEAPEGIEPEAWEQFRRDWLDEPEPCEGSGWMCDRVLDLTGNETLALAAQWLVEIPLRVLLVVVVALVLNRVVRRAIRRHLSRLALRSRTGVEADAAAVDRGALRIATASSILGSAATAVIFSIAVLVALSELGIDLAPMLAGAGIAGIAIGFGAQNLVRDILAGLFVIIEDQYGVGDIVDVGNASGVVEEFSLRVTKIRDVEGTLWFVPNGVITEVGNKTQLWSRAILDIDVAYDADHVEAGAIIKEVADRLWRQEVPGARIIEEPELWGVERFSESGVAIRLAVKSAPADQFRIARLLRSEIKNALDAAGIPIPVPQRTIWIRSARADGRPAEPEPAPGPGSSPA